MSLDIAITGHTRGIGQCIKELFERHNFTVFGLSRSNGYDLQNQFDEINSAIINRDSDIFINNAYVPVHQTKLLQSIYDKWKLNKKLIINIGSIASVLPSTHSDYNSEYATNKRQQRHFCEEHNLAYSKKHFKTIKCGLSNLNCDYVNTSFKSKYDKTLFPNLEPQSVANIIKFICDSFFNDNLTIREINTHSIV